MGLDGQMSGWDVEFPGDTALLTTLKVDLQAADVRRYSRRFELEGVEAELRGAGLPPQWWGRAVQEQVRFIERRYYQAQRAFQNALKLLARFFQAAQKPAKAVAEKVTAAVAEVEEPFQMIYEQTALIRIVDGKAVTTVVQLPARWFLEKDTFPENSLFRRQMVFEDGIPEEYAGLRTHAGKAVPPAEVVYVTYAQDEFLRLCRQEVDTDSEHLLDGERVDFRYQRKKD